MPRAVVKPSAAQAAPPPEPTEAELSQHEDEMKQFAAAMRKAEENGGGASIGAMALDVLLELVDDQIFSVIFESHRAFKLSLQSAADTIAPGIRAEGLVDIPGFDIFGNNPEKNPIQAFKCPHCGTLRQPAKFAPHLEKCMGMGGRELRRGAMRGQGKPQVPEAPPPAVKRKGSAQPADAHAAKVARVGPNGGTAGGTSSAPIIVTEDLVIS